MEKVFCGAETLMHTIHCEGVTKQIVEELLDGKHLDCVNDDRKTRIDENTGKESVLDRTLVSNNLAPLCDCYVHQDEEKVVP